jgi:uncharacterized membrane protein YheB (UPF0754 family)
MRTVIAAILITISTIILTAGIVFFAVIADRLGTQYLSLREQEAKNAALQDCYNTSYYEYKDKSGANIKETIKANYVNCVKDKGYTTVVEQLLTANQ